MNFITRLPISINWKNKIYDSILVIINRLTKMVYYKPIKITIDVLGLVEIIIEAIVWHYSLPDSIVRDQGFVFTSKFWSLLYHFLGIK